MKNVWSCTKLIGRGGGVQKSFSGPDPKGKTFFYGQVQYYLQIMKLEDDLKLV